MKMVVMTTALSLLLCVVMNHSIEVLAASSNGTAPYIMCRANNYNGNKHMHTRTDYYKLLLHRPDSLLESRV